MEAIIRTLTDAVQAEPRGLRPTQLLQQLVARCLHLLTQPDEEKLSQLAENSAEAARVMRPPDLESDELWRAWYAGHLHAVAALCRVMLRTEIPQNVRRRILAPNYASILLAFANDDEKTQTELLQYVATSDPSQLSREIARLQEMRVLDVAKEGRRSWVRLSTLGRRILAAPNLKQKLMDAVRRTRRESAVVAAEPALAAADSDRNRPAPAASPPRTAMVPVNSDDSGARLKLREGAVLSSFPAAPLRMMGKKEKPKTSEKLLRVELDDSNTDAER